MKVVQNHHRDLGRVQRAGVPALAFHEGLDGYERTPLRDLPGVAALVGVERLLAKDETNRFGLPAFKIVGASWTIHRALCKRLSIDIGEDSAAVALELRGRPEQPVLTCASAGNHGRAVARVARWYGLEAEVLLPATTPDGLTARIRSEGASVTMVPGTYDDAVAQAAAWSEQDERRLLVADISSDPADEVTSDIIDGYGTIVQEVVDQLQGSVPTHVVVPVGVGGLATATARAFSALGDVDVIAVEPEQANCLGRSLLAARPVSVHADSRSVMAGMNCGTLTAAAWPVLRRAVSWCLAVSDAVAIDGMDALASAGVNAGPCGGSTIGALMALSREQKRVMKLGSTASVVCLLTDGRDASGRSDT
jgi:diaminopropionate ammonia-lyase